MNRGVETSYSGGRIISNASKHVKVGCCGFPVARAKYYEVFEVVELQNTFYDLPDIEWAIRVRREAPGGFEFTVKAWQVITHHSTSPTWKKMRKKPEGEVEKYGYLRPTRENFVALEKTIEVARALESRIIVLQTPGSMPYTDESVRWVNDFFEEASSIASGIILAWEPRGEWAKAPELTRLLERHGIIHVTDLLREKPLLINKGVLYTRLHGLGGGEVNYSYTYTPEDLSRLKILLEEFSFEKAYVMFNNVKMWQNAQEFKTLLRG